ncbi:claudin-4-like [Rhincodon typus]|uniref:claudin-4-like n=1 Tax=Rhincodon typus TaxID=259920 RepID=UPI00202F71F2|nr:claudin-4-like [Rhincodon typus]
MGKQSRANALKGKQSWRKPTFQQLRAGAERTGSWGQSMNINVNKKVFVSVEPEVEEFNNAVARFLIFLIDKLNYWDYRMKQGHGLWMNCIVQSTGQMQCKVYDSLLALSQDLQASRALTVIAIVVGVLGILISIVGGKCTNCIENEVTKAKVTIVSGIVFILAGVLTLIPVSWSANTIIKDFYNPLVTDAQRRELGASLYIGWGTSGLLILGGALLCCSCPPKDDNSYSAKYSAARSTAPSKNYV